MTEGFATRPSAHTPRSRFPIQKWRRRESNPRSNLSAPTPLPDSNTGLLYAIEPEWDGPRTGPLKLGYTRDAESLAKRVSTLQISHWLTLRVVWTAPGSMKDERALHARLAAHRIRGEWFDAHPAVWEALNAISPLKEAA